MGELTLISAAGLGGLCLGIALARMFPPRPKKELLEIETLVVPPGSTVLIRIEDGLNEQELEMLRQWTVAAIKACPGITFAVVCDALFKVQVIGATE
ncbi:hypothetical protein BH10PSE16_BH10PSE16_01170 [soil metagenome]